MVAVLGGGDWAAACGFVLVVMSVVVVWVAVWRNSLREILLAAVCGAGGRGCGGAGGAGAACRDCGAVVLETAWA